MVKRLSNPNEVIVSTTEPEQLDVLWIDTDEESNGSSGGVSSVNTRTGDVVITKSDVELSNVNNTSDISKPISTLTQEALDAKQNTLVSATNIKTINNESLLGSGNITISGGGGGSSMVVFGRPVGESVGHTGAPAQWFATLYSASTTQDITTLKSYCINASGSNVVELGIYSEAGTLLGSATSTVTASGPFSVTLSTAVPVTIGTNYWLGICNQTNTGGTTFPYAQGNANSTAINRYSGGSSLPATLPAGNTTGSAFCVIAY